MGGLLLTIHVLVVAFVTLVKSQAEPVCALFQAYLEVGDAIVMPRRHGLVLTNVVRCRCRKARLNVALINQESAELNV